MRRSRPGFTTKMSNYPKYPKTPRLYGGGRITITEKIDGTNGLIYVGKPHDGNAVGSVGVPVMGFDDGTRVVSAGSRSRWITPDDDNYGFAKWVWDNAARLADALGHGYHYGEWFGHKIGRGYGRQNTREFALFATDHELGREVPGLRHVPVIADDTVSLDAYGGKTFDRLQCLSASYYPDPVLEYLIGDAAYEFSSGPNAYPESTLNPNTPAEGLILLHHNSGQRFKIMFENDTIPKGNQ